MKEQLDEEIEFLTGEWQGGQGWRYGEIAECPSYEAVKTLVKAIHTLEIYLYGKPKTMGMKDWTRIVTQK